MHLRQNFPILRRSARPLPVTNGILPKFEKSPFAHVLSIKYDPFNAAFIAWYIGGIGLMGALVFVFFVSHRRIWALVDKQNEENFEVVIGGNTNRNHQGFEDKFNKLVSEFEVN